MTRSLRAFIHSHGGDRQPLLRLRDHVQQHGLPDPGTVARLADELKLPPAAVRGGISYYADLHESSEALRVCHGTSCALAGAGAVHERLAAQSSCRKVYCLGYCDRSPAVLRPDDAIVTQCDREPAEAVLGESSKQAAMPNIHCVASQAIVTERIGYGDCSSLEAARRAGLYDVLERALAMSPQQVRQEMHTSGQRGRGGAGFPTAFKWQQCAETPSDVRYVIANGDEGDPGSFIDRVLMEHDPHALLVSMAICGHAVGARSGIVFIRSEYPRAIAVVERAIEAARVAGLIGGEGSLAEFDVTVFPGMGSYVCGEETAMLNSIEGFRGEVSLRPPYPAVQGLYGKPTVVNNIETLAAVPWIIGHGGEAYARMGGGGCRGTMALCLNHGFARPGIVEVEFGRSLREVIEKDGGGGRDGTKLEAVLIGGPMGSVAMPEQWDVPVCYEAMAKAGVQLGHGGLVAVPRGTDWGRLLRHWLTFMAEESCGKCVPCRVGSGRAAAMFEAGADPVTLDALLEVISQSSLCAFGQLMPEPMRTLLKQVRHAEKGA